ncbi:MAG: glycosyltransferase family 4 protein, partial [Acidimicrobiales bacterium]|nr:glycosyltransferase family 4 protein [Acidimicrobiales bacterium]
PNVVKPLEKPTGTLILSVGSLKPGKGIATNIEALSILRNKGFEIHYWIVGDGPLRKKLKKTATDLGVAKYTRFCGSIERSEIGNYMSSCDIFSLPSHPEAFGLAHLEAASLGKPVIACVDTGPAFNLPNELAALLVPPSDPNSVAEAWVKLIENPSLRNELGENGSKIARKFSWEKNASEFIKVIGSLKLNMGQPR